MEEELKACGKNGYGETFWKLCVPDEHCSPGLEVGITAGERGVTIGGRLLKWSEIDQARAQLPSQGGEAVAGYFNAGETGELYELFTVSKLKTGYYTEPLYTHPADQVAEGVVVSRELLERAADRFAKAQIFDYSSELRALLAKIEGVKKP